MLKKLCKSVPVAVVTGRPRPDAERFLVQHGIEECFEFMVCHGEAPSKPNPEGTTTIHSTAHSSLFSNWSFFHVCIYTYIHPHIYVPTHTHTHTHTYTHTHTPIWLFAVREYYRTTFALSWLTYALCFFLVMATVMVVVTVCVGWGLCVLFAC